MMLRIKNPKDARGFWQFAHFRQLPSDTEGVIVVKHLGWASRMFDYPKFYHHFKEMRVVPQGIGTSISFDKAKLTTDAAIIYGSARPLIDEGIYGGPPMEDRGQVDESIESWRGIFRMDTAAGRLAWRNKVFVMRVKETTAKKEITTVEIESRGGEKQTVTISVSLAMFTSNLVRIVGSTAGYSFSSYDDVIVQIASMTIVWSDTGQRIPVITALEGFVLKLNLSLVDAIAKVTSAAEYPELAVFRNDPAWNYKFTTFLPNTPRFSVSEGMLIVPAPWFFEASNDNFTELNFGILRFKFLWHYHSTLYPLQISTYFVTAHHQPFEMIYLPDDISSKDLQRLTLLQKPSILTRATGKVPQSEVCIS